MKGQEASQSEERERERDVRMDRGGGTREGGAAPVKMTVPVNRAGEEKINLAFLKCRVAGCLQ